MYVVFILPAQSQQQIRNAGHAFDHLAKYCRKQQTLASMPVYQSYEDAELAGLYFNDELRVPNTFCVCKVNGSLSDLASCEIEKMTLIGQESSTRSVMPFKLDKNLSMGLLLKENPSFDDYWSKPAPSITSISSRERLKQLLSTPNESSSKDTNTPDKEQQILSFGKSNGGESTKSLGKKEDKQPLISKDRKLKA